MTFTLLLLLPILSILQQFWISSVIRVYSGRSSRGERRTQHPFKFLRNISIEDPEKWRKNLKSIWNWKSQEYDLFQRNPLHRRSTPQFLQPPEHCMLFLWFLVISIRQRTLGFFCGKCFFSAFLRKKGDGTPKHFHSNGCY